ncbi:MAG: hypothetical protein JSU04_01250 [Bdellovibrionales bacterium]|nr:hypothetical protein [Bdellovibrionales bacterium]
MSFRVSLNLTSKPASELDSALLPEGVTAATSVPVDAGTLEALRNIITQFNAEGDALLTEIFSAVHASKAFEFEVVATSGVPAPYDAWTAILGEKPVMLFNLSEWSKEEISRYGLPILLHEVSHGLLAAPLKTHEELESYPEALEKIVIDEGIAHFIGFPGVRADLLEKHLDKWAASEALLKKAEQKLAASYVDEDEKEELLFKANTGVYWEKFGAISGMFRVAKIYQSQGPAGVVEAIKNLNLPRST